MNKKELLDKVKSLDGLSTEEKAYLINLVNTKKKYGLVWEDKLEDVEEHLRTHLPVLKEVKERAIINDTETEKHPNHILIEGDNLHALTSLTFTHKGKIDLIYIDPPYNTGNKDFIYNDSYVDKEDAFRHSKWISFISKRLKIAKCLLSDNGVIFISIDDNEQAQLRLLSNEILGENNFIGNIIWHNSSRTSGNQISTVHEYINVYAKSIAFLPEWKSKREGFEGIIKSVQNEWKKSPNKAQRLLKDFISEKLIENTDKFRFLKNYSNIDEIGHIFYAVDLSGDGQGEPRKFGDKILDAPKGRHWMSQEFIDNLYKENRIVWKGERPYKAVYLKDSTEKQQGIIRFPTRAGRHELKKILHNEVFNNPKPSDLILKLIKLGSNQNSIILDFFAGSGTTLHSTIRLNKEDGGNRKCILVTNNENNIADEVTYKRNKKVIQGYSNTKGDNIKGLNNNNLRYYQTDFVERKTSLTNKRKLTQLSTELLCIKENCYTEITSKLENASWHKFFTNGIGNFVYVIYDDMYIEDGVAHLTNFFTQNPGAHIKVYVFANGPYPYTEEFEAIAENIELVALPDAIYKAYQNILPKQNKDFVPELEEESPVEFDQ